MADATIHGIEFEIKGSSDAAVKSLERLSAALQRIKGATSGGVGLQKVASELQALNQAVQNTNIQQVAAFAAAMKAIGKIKISGRFAKSISQISKAVKGIEPQNLGKATKALASLSTLGEGDFSGLETVIERLTEISEIDFTNLTEAASALREIAGVTAQGGTESAEQQVTAWSKVKDALLGVLAVGGKVIALPFMSMGKRIADVVTKAKTLFSSIKRVAFYRVVRSAIKLVSEAFREGVKNAYEWSKVVGGPVSASGMTFAQSMDDIATSFSYFKNGIGAAVAPLIGALAPAIRVATDAAIEFLNVINQLIALLTGQSGWTRAIRQADEYGDAVGGAGGAAKEALRYLAPFDELNVLPSQKSGGGGGGSSGEYETMFEEMTSFTDGIAEFASKIREAIENADWESLGTLLGDKVNELVEKIDFAGIGTWIGEKINAWFSTQYWTLKTINFENIGAKIAEFLNNMLENIDFEKIGGGLVLRFTSIGDLIIGAVENIDWGTVGSSVGGFLKGALDEAADWIKNTDFGALFESIITGIFDFIKGLDVGELALSILDVLDAVIGAVADGIGTLLVDLAETIINPDTWAIVVAWMQDFPAKFKNAGIKAINAFVGSLTDGINKWIEKYNESPISDILGDIPPINFSLIPEIPEDELNKNYNRVKAKLEEKSKQDPVKIDSSGHIVSIDKKQITPSMTTFDGTAKFKNTDKKSLTAEQTTFNSKARFNTVKNNLSTNQSTFNTKAKFTSSIKSLNTDQKTFSAKAKFNQSANALSEQQRTFNGTVNVTKKTIKPTLNDGGNLKVDATAHITKVTGTTTIFVKKDAAGGVFQNGAWSSIPQFAGGGSVHGSLFLAGEAGAEIVGTVGGRTEVLNRSQIASAIYSAVRSAMVGTTIRVDSASASYSGEAENEEAMYRAFSRALADSDLGGDIELDGDVLYRAMVKRNRRNTRMTGVNAMA